MDEEPTERGSFEIVSGFKGHHNERVVSGISLSSGGDSESGVVKENIASGFEFDSIGGTTYELIANIEHVQSILDV